MVRGIKNVLIVSTSERKVIKRRRRMKYHPFKSGLYQRVVLDFDESHWRVKLSLKGNEREKNSRNNNELKN